MISGTAPFADSYRPDQALSIFNGKTGSAVNADIRNVECWSLFISPSSCPDGGGSCTIVPVQLASFTGRTTGNNNALIERTTVSKINNYGFEIQKSSQQNGTFETRAGSFVPVNGTTLVPHHYEWSDANASSQQPCDRLKQMDLDETTHYFDPIQVKSTC
ncbi:MAG: hypothetical protein AAB209_10545 [Bacteroidota bacterium]